MLPISTTINRGYVVLPEGNKFNKDNAKSVVSIINKLEKRNYVLSENVIISLFKQNKNTLEAIKRDIKRNLTLPEGEFLRAKFATSEDITKENFDFEDFAQQIYVYFMTYGLGIPPAEFNVERTVLEKRKVDSSDVMRKVKRVELKTIEELKEDLKNVIYLPIVFGEEQKRLIEAAQKENILFDLITEPFKVKENLFYIISIIGETNLYRIKNVFATSNDVLRYVFWASGMDYKKILDQKGLVFSLRTSQKNNVMKALNSFNLKRMADDAYPKRNLWKKVANAIHPASSKFAKYETAQKFFDWIRNGGYEKEIGMTFNQIKEKLIRKKDYIGLVQHLKQNQGVLLRSLDMILRNSSKNDFKEILKEIQGVDFNPKLLIEIRSYLKFRAENSIDTRIFKVRNKLIMVVDKPLHKLKKNRVSAILKVFNGIMLEVLEGKKLFKIQGEK